MKYYIISGEASGDIHGANLMKSLKEKDLQADFRFWGGDRMQEVGGVMVKHYRDLAYMGFTEVVAHLGTILRNLRFCKKDILQYSPDVLILIDYPGFNMRIARFARKKGLKTVYYIAPQVWAWRTGRIRKLKRDIDMIFTLLPFEKKFYDRYGAQVFFEGNPLVDAIASYKPDESFLEKYREGERPLIVLLPGSRRQEIERIFPLMLQVVDSMPGFRYVVAATPQFSPSYYASFIGDRDMVEVVYGHTYDLFTLARAGMVKSGTSTLEAALFGMPQVVCYKVSPLSYRIGRWVVNKEVRFISLVNLILDKPAVTELLQSDFSAERLKVEMKRILEEGKDRSSQLHEYDRLKEIMGGSGVSSRVAGMIVERFGSVSVCAGFDKMDNERLLDR